MRNPMRLRTASALVAVSVLSLLAGCLAGAVGASPNAGSAGAPLTFRTDWAEHAVPFSDHDHHDPLQHQGLSTPNFQLLGWDPLISDYSGRSAGGYLCGDARDAGDRRLAAVHGHQ